MRNQWFEFQTAVYTFVTFHRAFNLLESYFSVLEIEKVALEASMGCLIGGSHLIQVRQGL